LNDREQGEASDNGTDAAAPSGLPDENAQFTERPRPVKPSGPAGALPVDSSVDKSSKLRMRKGRTLAANAASFQRISKKIFEFK
jgi:hypothetical protein